MWGCWHQSVGLIVGSRLDGSLGGGSSRERGFWAPKERQHWEGARQDKEAFPHNILIVINPSKLVSSLDKRLLSSNSSDSSASFFGMATLGRQVKMKINRDVSVSNYSSSLRRCREGIRNPTVLHK